MSRFKLNKPESRAQSYLEHPIEYRKILHQRRDHHNSILTQSQQGSDYPPIQHRLQHKPSLTPSQASMRRHAKQLSFSQSQAVRRDNDTPLGHLTTPKHIQTPLIPKNSSLADFQSLQHPPTPFHTNPVQQKLSIKQQNRQKATPTPLLTIQDITERMNFLVNKKLQLMFQSIHGKGKVNNLKEDKGILQERQRQVNAQLQGLLDQMRQLQSLKGSDMHLLNQKISFIETLMAEQNAQVEMMKKRYYSISSNRIKGKVGDFTHRHTKVAEAYQSFRQNAGKGRITLPKNDFKKPLFKETTNKSSYKSPQSSDYESYRYRQRLAPINHQPLPRSSYKRDFLVHKTQPDQKIVNRDHSPYYPSSKTRVGSTYGQDYRRLKTENIDHRQLDAFKDKIRTLKVNYMPLQKLEKEETDDRAYREAVSLSRVRIQSNNSRTRTQHEPHYSKKLLLSESRREYQGQSAYEPSRIKHKQLQSFQYKLKHLFKL